MKKIILELRSLASLFLKEEEAVKINKFVEEEAWNGLRLFLGDLSEEYEINNLIADADQEKLDEWLAIDMMNDIAIELAIQMNEVEYEEKPSRRKRVIRD